MIRSDLISQLANHQEIPSHTAEAVINEMFSSFTDALVKGDKIEIRGFGSFEIRNYESYSARNPKTGAVLMAKAKKSPFFKVGKELKERVVNSTNCLTRS